MNQTASRRIGFIGLGVMGGPMAGHLSAAGHEVFVYNRSPAKVERWLQTHQGQVWTDLKAPPEIEILISCVNNDHDLRQLYLEETALLARLKPGSLVIDHTTASAEISRTLWASARSHQIDFLDAPVSGGEQGAIRGSLTIMCGGDAGPFARAESVMQAYAARCRRLGGAGSGQLCKMVNQICIAGLLQSLAEGLDFAERSGLQAQDVIDVISAGAAQSWQMDQRHRTMLAGEYEHGFAVDLMRKDLALVLEEGRRNGATLSVAALVDQFYADVQKMGGGRWDTSALLARLKQF